MILSNDEPAWTSKTSPVAVLVIMFSLSMGICICLISDWDTNFFSDKYLPLDNGIVLVSFLLLLTALVYLIYKNSIPVYKLYEDRLVISSKHRPDQTLYLSDIERWRYAESASRSGSIDTNNISLYFNDQKLTFNNLIISNLNELRDWLLKYHPDPEAKTKKYQFAGFLFGVIEVALIIAPIFIITSFQNTLNRDKGPDTVYVGTLVLSDDPEFISHSHKGSATTYEMRLKTHEIKDFKFVVQNIGHAEDRAIAEKNYRKNDSIDVSILQYDYDVKIRKIKEPTFWDKHLGWDRIKIKVLNSSAFY